MTDQELTVSETGVLGGFDNSRCSQPTKNGAFGMLAGLRYVADRLSPSARNSLS